MKVRQIICEQEQPLNAEELRRLEALKKKFKADNPGIDFEKDSYWGPLFRKAEELLKKQGALPPQADSRGMTAWERNAAIEFNKSLTSKQIEWAQNALRLAGIDVVGRKGVNDETFIGAIFDFQKISSITPTGKYDMRTIDALKYVVKTKGGNKEGGNKEGGNKEGGKPGPSADTSTGDFGNTVKEFDALPGKIVNVPDKGANVKIIDSKPYENDPETTVVIYAVKTKDGNVLFGITGINTKNRTEFILDQPTDDESRNINSMKKIYVRPNLRLKGPYTFYNGTIPAALADALTSAK